MDSVTQALLGATIGEAVAGRSAGRRAALWGAACGTLPDLDVLISYGNPIADFTWHRGYSHSLIVLTLAAPLVWWLISRIDAKARGAPRRWLTLVWLALITHPLLDALTVYGTQLLLPFSDYPFALSSVFIIDPLVTLPLAIGLGIALWSRTERSRAAAAALIVACGYLAAGAVVKQHVDARVEASLAAAGDGELPYLSAPAPFNILLWRIIVMEPGGYREAWYSVLDPAGRLQFTSHASDAALLAGLHGNRQVDRLRWFTKGFYRVRDVDGRIVMTDLRMGGEPWYVFNFVVGERNGSGSVPVPAEELSPAPLEPGQLGAILERIKGPAAAAAAPAP